MNFKKYLAFMLSFVFILSTCSTSAEAKTISGGNVVAIEYTLYDVNSESETNLVNAAYMDKEFRSEIVPIYEVNTGSTLNIFAPSYDSRFSLKYSSSGNYDDVKNFDQVIVETDVNSNVQTNSYDFIKPGYYLLESSNSSGRVRVSDCVIHVNNSISEVKVLIDGVVQNFTQPAFIIDGSTMVPMRAIFEKLGATVAWNQSDEAVYAIKGSTSIVLYLGMNRALVNGEDVSLSAKAQLIDGNTMVPLRFVSEALGAEVEWNADTATATISTNSAPLENTVLFGLFGFPLNIPEDFTQHIAYHEGEDSVEFYYYDAELNESFFMMKVKRYDSSEWNDITYGGNATLLSESGGVSYVNSRPTETQFANYEGTNIAVNAQKAYTHIEGWLNAALVCAFQ